MWSIAGKDSARGREKTLGAAISKRIKKCIEAYRFVAVVRAPWVKKHLKLKCSTRTVPIVPLAIYRAVPPGAPASRAQSWKGADEPLSDATCIFHFIFPFPRWAPRAS